MNETETTAPEHVFVATSSLLRGYGYTYLANDGAVDLVKYVRADMLAAAYKACAKVLCERCWAKGYGTPIYNLENLELATS